MGVELTVASEQPSSFESLRPEAFLTLDFGHPERAAEQARAVLRDAVKRGHAIGNHTVHHYFLCGRVYSKRAAQEIQRGNLKLVLVEGEQGVMLLVQAGPDAILAVAAKPGKNLGMIFLDARKVAQKLLAALESHK